MLKKFNKYRKLKNSAVSEVFGTVLLLLISVSVFSTVYASFFAVNVPPQAPSVTLVASIDDNNFILYHRGGVSLGFSTYVIMRFINDQSETFDIGSKIIDTNGNSLWDVGEKTIYDLSELTNFVRYNPINICVIDPVSNSMILVGTIQEQRSSDLQISINIDEHDMNPEIPSQISVQFQVYNAGPSYTTNVNITIDLPSGIEYDHHNANENYDPIRGLWSIDYIDYQETKTLDMILNVGISEDDITQFVIIIDGSDGVTDQEFEIIKNGIAEAIKNNNIPLNGIVQLTVIQYAGNTFSVPSNILGKIELGPIPINEDYLDYIYEKIMTIEKMGGDLSPMACGIWAANRALKEPGWSPNWRKVITIVTGSIPNCVCGDFYDVPTPESQNQYTMGKISAWQAREALIKELKFNSDRDEIDAVGILTVAEEDLAVEWLKQDIAWPGSYEWPSGPVQSARPPGPGWVRIISNHDEFEAAINYNFNLLFNSRRIRAEIISRTHMDPIDHNNFAEVLILPYIP
jgi:hypothetical protein